MNRLTRISVLAILFLSPALCRAENVGVTHDFNSMFTAKTLKIAADEKVGTTDLATYTCTGENAKFAGIVISKSRIVGIYLPETGSMVTTTRIEDLYGFQMTYNPSDAFENINIYLSTDSVEWGAPLSESELTERTGGSLDAHFPLNDYYVRIVNNDGGKDVFLKSIHYYMNHCPKCFEYKE